MSSPLVDLQLLYTAAPVVTHLGHALLVQHMVARERLAPDTWRVQALQADAAARRIRPVTTVRVGACIGSSMYAVLVTRAVCTGILDPLPGPLRRPSPPPTSSLTHREQTSLFCGGRWQGHPRERLACGALLLDGGVTLQRAGSNLGHSGVSTLLVSCWWCG